MAARKLTSEVRARGRNTDDYRAAVRIHGLHCQIRVLKDRKPVPCHAKMECVLKIGTGEPIPVCAGHRRFYLGSSKEEKAREMEAFISKQVRIPDVE